MSEPEPNVLTVAVDRDAGGVDVVTLRGELDFASGEPLSTADDILHPADVVTVVKVPRAALDEIPRSEPTEARREGDG